MLINSPANLAAQLLSVWIISLVKLCSTESAQTVQVKGVLGGQVSLPCYVNVNDCGEVYFVAWTKSDTMKQGTESWPRIYMYSDSINKPLGELVSRASFHVDRSTGGSLTVNNIKPNDQGYYRCDVTYISVGKCPSLTYVHLQVLQPPKVIMEPRYGLTVEENVQPATFHCTYSANPMQLLPQLTKWFKDGQQLEIPLPSSGGSYVTYTSDHPVLTIVNVTRNHTGSYSCQVSNEIGSGKSSQGVALNVIYRPQVALRIYPDATKGLLIKEGDDIQLICDIEHGNPLNASKVRWIKKTNDGSEMIINETSQNQIVWLSVDRSLTANYSCSALNEAGWSDESGPVELNIKYLASQASIQQINRNYPLKGDQLVLECIVHQLGWPPASEYVWEQDGFRLEDERSSILNITTISLATKGNYSCAAVSQVGMGPKGYMYISPVAPPKMIDSLPKTSGALYNAPRLSVSCRVECDPICSINWLKNGSLIARNSSDFYITEGQKAPQADENIFLSIMSTLSWNMSRPLRKDSDPYEVTCASTSNFVGVGVASSMMFQVEYPPENLTVIPSIMNVVEGTVPQPIKCHSKALPPPSYRWERWGVPIVVSDILEIQNPVTTESGFGNYTCVAYNRHGAARVDAVINVLHKPSCEVSESAIRLEGQERPAIVLICEATANPSDGLIFEWKLSNTSYTLPNSSDIMSVNQLRSHLIIAPEQRRMFGLWTCSVTNQIGTSECAFYKSAPIVDSRWMMPHLDDKSIILIAALLALIIIIFIFILIIIFCRMKRRRAKQEAHQMTMEREKPEASPSPSSSSLSNHSIPNKDANRKMGSQLQSMPNREDRHFVDSPPSLMPLGHEPYDLYGSKKSSFYGIKPHLLPQYENIAQLTNELRRTQSARYIEKDLNIIKYGPLERNIVYADLQITNDDDEVLDEKNSIFHTSLAGTHHLTRPNHHHHRRICDYAVLNFDQTHSPTSFC